MCVGTQIAVKMISAMKTYEAFGLSFKSQMKLEITFQTVKKSQIVKKFRREVIP